MFKTMKLKSKVYSLAALLAVGSVSTSVFAQEDVKSTTVVETTLMRGYIRSVVTMLYVTNRNDKTKEILFELQ